MIDGERSESAARAGNRAEWYGAAVAARFQANRFSRQARRAGGIWRSSTTRYWFARYNR
ncbi:hypothetical protein KCP76_00230 [Salmonella enterica subsp. enterica serovar Weltevreden]|nr:hypothetical protein KCP76_00230 [Salmonella enterica subsp. enterica serovar Weltevreden]